MKLLRSLPDRWKVSVSISPGTHASEAAVNKQLADKGADINGYMEKHNIQLKDQQGGAKKDDKSGAGDSKSGGGVLVA